MKCGDCDGEAGKNRACTFCGKPLCWSHVTRISLAVHEDNICREVPFYLCRSCLRCNPMIMLCLIHKYDETEYEVYNDIRNILEIEDE
jgi:hypothetical protein